MSDDLRKAIEAKAIADQAAAGRRRALGSWHQPADTTRDGIEAIRESDPDAFDRFGGNSLGQAIYRQGRRATQEDEKE